MEKIWIDGLAFENKGGFIAETQFIREMGQGYLLADGAGIPVEPASTAFNVNNDGRYRVFIRTKNWDNEYSPDGLVVSVDETESRHICEKMHRCGWYWEIAGEYVLSKGKHTLKIDDTQGWFGRFSAVIITDDFDFSPSPEINKMLKQRAEILKIDGTEVYLGDFDLAVAGAGAAGIVTAITAARYGLKVALICDRPVLGGNGSDEAHISLDGAGHRGNQETGVIFEIKAIKERENLTWSQAFERTVEKEKNITLYKNMLVDNSKTANGIIENIHLTDTYSLRGYTLSAKFFCDATGDGWLGYYSDAVYHIGREAKSQYNEKFAPEFPDENTMSGCITKTVADGGDTICGFYAKDTEKEVPFVKPQWAYKLPEGDDLGREPKYLDRGEWWLETPNDYDDLWESEYVRDTMFKITVGYFDWLKNSWQGREKVKNYKLEGLGTYNAKRESRRLIGDYIMTQNDFAENTEFPDGVCYAGWHIDVHHVNGIFSGRDGVFTCNENIPITPIPFRCLYSKNIDNLFMVGRCISTSHLGLGATRVQMTCATMGQAVGTAVYLCGKYNLNPREICKEHIKELQQLLLKDGQYIPGVYNNDKDDIARHAEIFADSETENGKAINIINGKTRPFDGEDYAWISSKKLPQSITLKFKEKKNISQIRITFDIPFERYKYSYMAQPEQDETVTDFFVEYSDGNQLKKLAEIKDNFQRLVVVDCGDILTDEIKITAVKCHKAQYATITEIRVY